MMLGALAQHESPKRILDAGAGCGVLGLMMAQRFPDAEITCIELDEKAADECYKNVESSPFRERIKVIQGDLLASFTAEFDLIVSNPPYYFTDNSSSQRNNTQKHSTREDFSAWIRACYALLAPFGTFCMIYPHNQEHVIAALTSANKFHEQTRHVLLNQHQQGVRIISAFTMKACQCIETNFSLRNQDGTYSEAYLELTQEFHAKTPLR
jgi:tRNA1Val (adenine37-N6)-methyltransferase